ncbi:hypothetical protein JTE90_026252, partial [Oedothorax gibbosus]
KVNIKDAPMNEGAAVAAPAAPKPGDAKKFVESCPQVVKGDIGKEEADKLKEALEAVGGTCEIS